MKDDDKNTDFIITFFQYLKSRSMVRLITANKIHDYGTYVFSVPGREIMSDTMKRTALISEFMNFYNPTTA